MTFGSFVLVSTSTRFGVDGLRSVGLISATLLFESQLDSRPPLPRLRSPRHFPRGARQRQQSAPAEPLQPLSAAPARATKAPLRRWLRWGQPDLWLRADRPPCGPAANSRERRR